VRKRYCLYATPKRISSSRSSYHLTKNSHPGVTLTATHTTIQSDWNSSESEKNQAMVHSTMGFRVQPYVQSVASRLDNFKANGAPRPRNARFATVRKVAIPVITESAMPSC